MGAVSSKTANDQKKKRQRRNQERECGRKSVRKGEKRKWDTDGVRQEGVLLGDTEAGCQYDVFISLLASCQAYGSRWPAQAGGRWEVSRREYHCPLIHFFNTHLIFSRSSSRTLCCTTHIAYPQVSSCSSAFLTLHGRIIGGVFPLCWVSAQINWFDLVWLFSISASFENQECRKVRLQPRTLCISHLKGHQWN